MNKLKKIVNKISSLKSVFTPADKYNELIDNHNELITVVEELYNNSGGGGTTDLFTNTTASKFVKTNSTNDGLESTDLFENTNASQFVKTNSTNDGLESINLFEDTTALQFVKTNSTNDGLQSVNLFSETSANKAVKANSTNTGLEDLPISIDETNKKVLIGETFANSGSIINQCVLISGDNSGNNAINGTTSKSNIIGINAVGIKRGNISVIGNLAYKTFAAFGNMINGFNASYLTVSSTISVETLLEYTLVNSTTNTLTMTISGSVDNLVNYHGVVNTNATLAFIVDNTTANTGNDFTIAFSDPTFSVNGTDSLVVSSGTVGKFELYMYYDFLNNVRKAKVCRVY